MDCVHFNSEFIVYQYNEFVDKPVDKALFIYYKPTNEIDCQGFVELGKAIQAILLKPNSIFDCVHFNSEFLCIAYLPALLIYLISYLMHCLLIYYKHTTVCSGNSTVCFYCSA